MPRELLLPEMIDSQAASHPIISRGIQKARRNPTFCDIDMNRWKDYLGDVITDSLWILGSRDRSGPHVGDYHGNFVPQIAYQVITRFTKKKEIVLDLFNGMGTTLIECSTLGRHGIGVELSGDVLERSRERIGRAENPDNVKINLIQGDSTNESTMQKVKALCEEMGRSHVQHVVLHPPYWDIIQFSNGTDPLDLACCPTEDDFLRRFEMVVKNAHGLLEPRKFMTLVIGDAYSKGEWIPLGFECMNVCRRAGFRLKAINVKDIQGNEKGKGNKTNLWKYRALKQGFYVFKHEYIIIFQKI
jgi:SAM-dependent methyltransferase